MAFDEEKLKAEMQSNGFIDELKERHLLDSSEMSALALEKFEENNGEITRERVYENFSELLSTLIDIETTIFNVRKDRVYPKALTEFLNRHYQSGQVALSSYNEDARERDKQFAEYPETQAALEEIADKFSSYDDFEEAFGEIFPIIYHLMKPITESERQSAGKRAGLGFKNQFENLIEITEYSIEQQESGDNGYILHITRDNGTTAKPIFVGFHTTLKDRYRSTFSDIPEDMPRYLMTGTGAGIYGKSDTEDITLEKINSIADHGFKLVVLKEAATKFPQRNAVITYEEFLADELPDSF